MSASCFSYFLFFIFCTDYCFILLLLVLTLARLTKETVNLILNDNHREKLCFTQLSVRMAASDLLHMFTQSIEFYNFHYHIFQSTDV